MAKTLPTVPAPPEALVPATTLAEFPAGSFLENLAVGPDGALYVTCYVGSEIFRVDLHTWDWSSWVKFDGVFPMGIAFDRDGSAIIAGQRQPGFDPRTPATQDGFWRVAQDGTVSHLVDLPGAGFVNGLQTDGQGRFYCADSLTGDLWLLDTATGTARSAINSALLAPRDRSEPFPAANGLKLRDGAIYVSNWVQGTIVRGELLPDGSVGPLEVIADEVMIDDFDFGPDGSIYGASHILTVVRIAPDGAKTTIGGIAEGVHGCTATMVEPGGGSVLVITDGGCVAEQLEPARIVRLQLS